MAKKSAAASAAVPNLVYHEPELIKQVRTHLGFEIHGTAPLIMNRFSEKTIYQMLSKHMGRDEPRQKKVPREVIEQAIQRNEAGVVALPSTSLKRGILAGASVMKNFSRNKTALRVGLFIKGASVPITYAAMVPRMDIVRNSGINRDPDIRFRPQFNDWSARFVVVFDDAAMAESTIIDLVSRAGDVGVGEWRPEKNGDYGTFEISKLLTKEESIATMKACAPIIKPIQIPAWALDAGLDLAAIQKILHENAEAEDAAQQGMGQ